MLGEWEAWRAMSVYFIPPTGNFETCIHGKKRWALGEWAGSFSRNDITNDVSRCQVMWQAFLEVLVHMGVLLCHTCAANSISGKWLNGFASELIVCLRAPDWGRLSPEAVVRAEVRARCHMLSTSTRFALTHLRHCSIFGLVWQVPGLTGVLDKFCTTSGRKAKLVSGSCISSLSILRSGS